ELSDIDLELYVREPERLLGHDEWYRRFGEVLVVEVLENPEWHPTRLVYYANGKVDFMIASVDVAAVGVAFDRPFQVVVDKDGLADRMSFVPAVTKPPTPEEFTECIHWFYAAALMWVKHCVRRDPWAAKLREWEANGQLLRMVEWDHRSRHGWDYDTWYLGSHLRDWMDADTVEALSRCWADFSEPNMANAAAASVALFDALSGRAADAVGLPRFDARAVRFEIDQLVSRAGDGDRFD
ncbi:MAG: aminoglycoside 6-adenylyltransferase, partial [Actinomycetota bacterium]|nr:aminoglycoside 6-adenylyltransferase [Actinomycetota bacterium]